MIHPWRSISISITDTIGVYLYHLKTKSITILLFEVITVYTSI